MCLLVFFSVALKNNRENAGYMAFPKNRLNSKEQKFKRNFFNKFRVLLIKRIVLLYNVTCRNEYFIPLMKILTLYFYNVRTKTVLKFLNTSV